MKQNTIKPIPIVLFCILAMSLLSVPVVQGAVQPKEMTFASDVVEERVDCLITYLKQKAEMRIPDDFKTVSGLKKELSLIGKPGLAVQAVDAERTLNKAAKEVLGRLLERTAEGDSYRSIIVALLDSIDQLPEGFCQPEAYESGKDLVVNGRDLYDDREHYKDPPVDSGNFIYYGKKYTLPDDANVASNGILFMSGDPFHYSQPASEDTLAGFGYPPFITPL